MTSILRFFKRFDWISFGLILALCGIGLCFVYSATYTPECPYSIFFKKQCMGVMAGIMVYWLFSIVDYRIVARLGYFAYFGVLGLLLFTLFKGSIGMGGQRWINLFFFKMQPSELAKLFFPAFVVHYCRTQETQGKAYSFGDFMPVLCILGVSFLLVLRQPDLGTALIMVFSGSVLLWLLGLDKRFFMYCFLGLLITAPLSWKVLKPYQKKRVLVFLGYGDTRSERYQIEQSKIAIGSGGVSGKGFLRGTQNTLQFLPESRTDFIFAVLAEELGFLGIIGVLALYLLLFLRIFIIICALKDPLVQVLAVGLVMHVVISVVVNIAMVSDLLPVVGIPLPFMSYGLSNLLITQISFGWINGIKIRSAVVEK